MNFAALGKGLAGNAGAAMQAGVNTPPSPKNSTGIAANVATGLVPTAQTQAAQQVKADNASKWYGGLANYGTTDGWGGFADTYNGQSSSTEYGKSGHASDIQGGMQFLNAGQTVGVDRNGTVYVQLTTDTGDKVWQPYQQGSTAATYQGDKTPGSAGGQLSHQALTDQVSDGQTHYAGATPTHASGFAGMSGKSGQLDTAAGIYGSLSGKKPPTNVPGTSPTGGVSDGPGNVDPSSPVAAPASGVGNPTQTQASTGTIDGTNVVDPTKAVGAANGDTSGNILGENTSATQPPAVNPVNHNFINALQQSIQTGNNAATANAQQQAVTNSNMERLAAGANTLNGNYAAQGAAGQGQEALLGQQNIQQGNLAGAQQTQNSMHTLGQALSQESSQSLDNDKAGLDQQITNIGDTIQTLQTQIAGKTDQQSLALQQYINSLTNSISQYQAMAASSNWDTTKGIQTAQAIFSALGPIIAMAAAA